MQVWKVLFISKDSSCSCTQMFWEYWITAIEQLLERRIKPVWYNYASQALDPTSHY